MTTYARRGEVRSDAAHDVLGPSADAEYTPPPSWQPAPRVPTVPGRYYVLTFRDGRQVQAMALGNDIVLTRGVVRVEAVE